MKKINTLYNCTGYPQLFESESTSSESTSSESTSSESTSSESTISEEIAVLKDELVALVREDDHEKATEIQTRIDELTLIEGNYQVYPYLCPYENMYLKILL